MIFDANRGWGTCCLLTSFLLVACGDSPQLEREDVIKQVLRQREEAERIVLQGKTPTGIFGHIFPESEHEFLRKNPGFYEVESSVLLLGGEYYLELIANYSVEFDVQAVAQKGIEEIVLRRVSPGSTRDRLHFVFGGTRVVSAKEWRKLIETGGDLRAAGIVP